MKKRVLSAAFSGMLALALALAGCSGSQQAAQPSDNQGGQPEQKQPQQPAETGKTGEKVLIYGRGGDTVSLDPATIDDGESARVTENIMETLVEYADGTMEIVPGLAEKWDIDPSGLKYTFHLRKGVKFHDGTDFNAEAVKFNFERWMDKNNPLHSPEGFAYYNDMFGGYKGDPDHVIKEVKVVDEYTVEFDLNRSQAPFLANLGMFPFAIASPKALQEQKEKFGEHPVGTGPFTFVEWQRNDHITIEKNPDYWNKDLPKLDKVVFKVIPDNSARLTALQSGEIDVMDGLNPEDAETVKANSDLQLMTRPPMNIGFLSFNVEKKPFDDKRVRQAIAYAVNKPALVEAFYSGLAMPAVNIMPPILLGYNDQIKDREFNLEKAKQLLAEAGYPDGFKTKFWAMPVPRPYIPNGQKMAEAMQQDFKKIGIETEIVTMDWATYLDKTKKGEQEMYLLGWNGDNGDPDNFIYVLLDKNNIGGGNRTRYANEEVHQLLLKAQTEVDPAKRSELYKKVQEILFDEVPVVPIAHAEPGIAAKASVKNYIPHPKGTEYLKKVDME
ncbi:ABC transporter substrate-binding protein [Brevibacillus massiliensis]|uniref:ABC transporter substrate-binding protein n=1 Tax=Brevibacillus massiliensis TaxID=1118054 RepID=UPI000306F098|nr:ABC transporter substrate-binding protein [Brevibacillus massiliensis]